MAQDGGSGTRAAEGNRRVVVERYGGPERLRLQEEPLPEPGGGEVRVRVLAAEVNFSDLLLREGVFPGGPQPPFTPGYDLVGEIDALGPGTQNWREGQRVAALTVYGAYADHVCVPAWQLVPVPDALPAGRAASLVLSYVTAYQLLHRVARAEEGQRVLVQGAGGAVGRALLQLGALKGLVRYGTATGEDMAEVAAQGATAIDYRVGDVRQRVRRVAGGGVDLALDGIGGRTAWASYRALRPGGRLVLFGHRARLAGGRPRRGSAVVFYAVGALIFAAAAIPPRKRVTVYRIAEVRERRPEWFREDLTLLLSLLSHGEIDPLPTDELPLERAAEAHVRLGEGEVRGKQVLRGGGA